MLELSEGDFQASTLRIRDKTVVLFHASWCPYCKLLMPTYEKFGGDAKVDVARVDISDFESPLWDAFSIEAVPTAIIFEKGEPVARVDSKMGSGVTPAEFLQFAEQTQSI